MSSKRQSRLSFTPLPSSSPVALDNQRDLKRRAGPVPHSNSFPSKRRMKNHWPEASDDNKVPHGTYGTSTKGAKFAVVIYTPSRSRKDKQTTLVALPTPQNSSQHEALDERSTISSAKDAVAQASDSDIDTQILPSPVRPQRADNKRSLHHLEIARQTPFIQRMRGTKSRLSGHLPYQNQSPVPTLLGDDLSKFSAGAMPNQTSGFPALARRGQSVLNKAGGTNQREEIEISSDSISDSDSLVFASPPRTSQKINTGVIHRPEKTATRCNGSSRQYLLGGASGNAPLSASKSRSSSKRKESSTAKTPKNVQRQASGGSGQKLISTASDDNEELAVSPVRRHRRQQRALATKTDNQVIDADEEEDQQEDEEEDVVMNPSIRRRRMNKPRIVTTHLSTSPRLSEETSSSRACSTASTGEGRTKKLHLNPDQEEEDLMEDLELLEENRSTQSISRTRSAPSRRENRQKYLAVLKRRRAGAKEADMSTSLVDNQVANRGFHDNDLDMLRSAGHDADEHDSHDSSGEEGSGAESIPDTLRSYQGDEYEGSFVDDDEDNTIGAPSDLSEIPIEFTHHARKPLEEHFRDAVEWMVHNKLNPAFLRNDALYKLAFSKLEKEVQGYTASKFVSTAWVSSFTRALQARPVFYEMELPVAEGDKCDACNKTKHPPKFQVKFGGTPYHRDTLEDVSDASEDESGEDDAKSVDSKGRSIPDSETLFAVGRFCKANAGTAHSLTHWRYHLNQWVIDYLTEKNHLSAEKIVEREGWAKKQKGRYANDIIDDMERNGEIQSLFRDFNINLDAARDVNPSHFKRR